MKAQRAIDILRSLYTAAILTNEPETAEALTFSAGALSYLADKLGDALDTDNAKAFDDRTLH